MSSVAKEKKLFLVQDPIRDHILHLILTSVYDLSLQSFLSLPLLFMTWIIMYAIIWWAGIDSSGCQHLMELFKNTWVQWHTAGWAITLGEYLENNNNDIYYAIFMADTILNVFHVTPHLNFTTNLHSRYCYIIDVESEEQRC